MPTMINGQKVYKRGDLVAKAWGKPLGIIGKQGSKYLYLKDEDGRFYHTYRPFFSSGRAIAGWRQLGFMLVTQGIAAEVYAEPEADGRRRFLGYTLDTAPDIDIDIDTNASARL